MSDWRAAAVSAISIDDFGSDPVAVAVQKHKRGENEKFKEKDSDTGTQRSELTINVGGDVLDDSAVGTGAKAVSKRQDQGGVEQVERTCDDHRQV